MGKAKYCSTPLPLSNLQYTLLLIQFLLPLFTLLNILFENHNWFSFSFQSLSLFPKLSERLVLMLINLIFIFLSLLGFFGYFFKQFKIILLHSALSIIFGTCVFIYLLTELTSNSLSYKASILTPIYFILIGFSGILYYNLYESEYGSRGDFIDPLLSNL